MSTRRKRRKGCRWKTRYATKEKVKDVVSEINKKKIVKYGGLNVPPPRYTYYKCKFCGGYHIGRSKPRIFH